MPERQTVCPADPHLGNAAGSAQAPEATGSFLDDLPRLKALVSGPDGEEILAELQKLSCREPQRARRFQRDMFARIRADPQDPPEVAIVRDVSRSGVRLQVASSARLDVIRARNVFIEMRLPGAQFVSCEATLVRVVEHHQNGVELAFSFARSTGIDPALEELLAQLAAKAERSRP
jgi:hypothetical protein